MPNYNQSEINKFTKDLECVKTIYEGDPVLDAIVKHKIDEAAEDAYNAGMGGYHHDGGARASIQQLKIFLQGVQYGETRDTENLGYYLELHETLNRENDPEYKEYLRLKALFEDK